LQDGATVRIEGMAHRSRIAYHRLKRGLSMHPLLLCALLALGQTADDPRSLDPRLEIVQIAASPDIVHPIACDVDKKGRLLVVESHTHFRPKDYKGPPTDRIRMIEIAPDSGKADKITTFWEGSKFTMNLAVHPLDGSVYVATRNEIFRLRDTKGTGTADEKTRLVLMETKGDYPHNGLSGLCFDSKGDVYFGLGENLGEKYKMTAADGKEIADTEGGKIFHMSRDGKDLRVVATGFWNPFGTCRDIYGRLFAVDNDPDSRPPCRLVHVVEGGDYGFQFRYGRAGRHPFQAWNGELPGTLPYVSGVGEAPCAVMSYESDGLPDEYRGDLLVTSWADHRLERYTLEPKGASFTSKTKVVIQGGKDFRPVGMALAPDGSLFLTDWVRRDYNLHGKGAVWHVRWKEHRAGPRPTDPVEAIKSMHRPLREAAARTLLETKDGHKLLEREGASSVNLRIRETCSRTLSDEIERKDPALVKFQLKSVVDTLAAGSVPGSAEWESEDPFVRHSVVEMISKHPDLMIDADKLGAMSARSRLNLFLAHRLAGRTSDRRKIPEYLESSIEDIRFLTAKWIADEQLRDYYPLLQKAIQDPKLNTRLYLAYATAMARCEGQPVNEIRLAAIFLQRVQSDKTPADQRVQALRLIPTSWGGLTTDMLGTWAHDKSPGLALEAVRALSEHPSPKRYPILLDLARNGDPALKREAFAGIADKAGDEKAFFLGLVDDPALGDDALRDLINVPLTGADKTRLQAIASSQPARKTIIDRVLGQPVRTDAPKAIDTSAWLKRLDGPADVEAGRRVFFHPKLAGCFRCHRADGRGRDIGPDLSTIGQRPRRFILESILEPSKEVGPSFQTWQIEMNDGRVKTGLLMNTNLDDYEYVDSQGEKFRVNTRDVADIRGVPTSIMPDGLVDRLTDQELRDLLAFLEAKK
jgi:putative membrane-bound dehydrogenase-like protein